jgi:hypothetical protein
VYTGRVRIVLEYHFVAMENPQPNGMEHPRGTLAIVLIYALLFALGWLLLYYGEFLPRG